MIAVDTSVVVAAFASWHEGHASAIGKEHARLVRRAAEAGIVGGSIHDALVGTTVRHAGARLLTRDRRAAPTYERLGVEYELIG